MRSWIGESLERWPDKIAICGSAGTLTYAELDQQSRQYGRLAEHDVVAVHARRSSAQIVAFLGVLRAGSTLLPIDVDTPPERVREMLDLAGATAVVSDIAGTFGTDRTVIPLGASPGTGPVDGVDAGRPAYLVFTSGSTGSPKGILISAESLLSRFEGIQQALRFRPDDRFAYTTTPAFDIAFTEWLFPLLIGAGVWIPASTPASGLAAELVSGRPTVIQGTPTFWQHLLATGWSGSPEARLLSCGEPVPQALAERLLEAGAEFWNLYGPAEATIYATVARLQPGRPVTVGRELPGVSIVVVDERLRAVPDGVEGELLIQGVGLAEGYLNLAEETAARFVTSPSRQRGYLTGDRGVRGQDGRLVVNGRLDRQVKVLGHRVELDEIEAVLAAVPGVLLAAVEAVRRAALDVRLAAAVTVRSPGAVSEDELKRQLRARLPEYMVPSYLKVVSALPETTSGKVDRKAATASTVPPGLVDDLENVVAGIWSETLGEAGPAGEHTFFALGGTSLKAMAIIVAVEQRTGVCLATTDVLSHPDVRSLTTIVRQRLTEQERPELPAPQDGRRRPLLFSELLDGVTSGWLEAADKRVNLEMIHMIEGEVDLAALEHAIELVAGRHPALGRRLAVMDGEYLWVPTTGSVDFEVVTVPADSTAAGRAMAEEAALTDAQGAFDPRSESPPLRARCYLVAKDQSVLMIACPHFCVDVWSQSVFARDLSRAYESLIVQADSDWPTLPDAKLDRPLDARTALEYWHTVLARSPQGSNLGTLRDRQGWAPARIVRQRLFLPDDLVPAVAGFRRQQGLTPLMVLMAGVQVLYYRYSGELDLAAASTVVNRFTAQDEQSFGLLSQRTILRTVIDPGDTFTEVCLKVRETIAGAFDHLRAGVEPYFVAAMPPQLGFQAPAPGLLAVDIDVMVEPELTLAGAKCTLSRPLIPADIRRLGDDALYGVLVYHTDSIWPQVTEESVVRHLWRLISSGIDENCRVGDLPMLDQSEIAEIAGRPVQIVGAEGRLLPLTQAGVLVVGEVHGNGVVTPTAEPGTPVTVDGKVYAVGDYVRWTPDGGLAEIAPAMRYGRVRGVECHLDSLERVLRQAPGVEAAHVEWAPCAEREPLATVTVRPSSVAAFDRWLSSACIPMVDRLRIDLETTAGETLQRHWSVLDARSPGDPHATAIELLRSTLDRWIP